MCGIIGIINSLYAREFLLNGLEQLSGRGYDGYGIAFTNCDPIKVGVKQLENLKKLVADSGCNAVTGIAHNRWATHGIANDINAHPHKSGPITIVHNGDLDNYEALKKELIKLGYEFHSETDSEVFAVLVHHYRKDHILFDAVYHALLRLGPTSRFAFLIMDDTTPDTLVVARRGSNPIVWAQSHDTIYLSSQPSVFNGYSTEYHELPEGHMVILNKTGTVQTKNFTGDLNKEFKKYTLGSEFVQDAKTEQYWMYQEMKQATKTVADALGHRATMENGIVLGGLEKPEIQSRLKGIDQFIIAGCGTSYHAAEIIAMAIEEVAGISARAIVASEYIYRTTVFNPEKTALIVVSQSGETADVIRLMTEWKSRGMLMLGIVNVPDTQIPRLTDAGIYCGIGPEIAVASTKAFLGQLVCGYLFALWMGQQRGLSVAKRNEYIKSLLEIPEKVQQVFSQGEYIKTLAEKYASTAQSFLYLGRLQHAIVAAEGALKLKEISYIHAESYPSGEMKHGTIALIDENFPTFVIAPDDQVFDATMNNVKEIQARKGKVIMVTDKTIDDASIDCITIPTVSPMFSPLVSVIPTQLFAYYACLHLGYDPDQPRNLAKSVTVE